MRAAVVEMEGYVSPRLAWCTHLRIAGIDAGHILHEESRDVCDLDPAMLVNLLNELELDVLACGGIPPEMECALHPRELRVIRGVIGTGDQVLQALAHGRLRNDDVANHHPGRATRDDAVDARGQC